jgi:hypothetical protein
VDDAAALRDLTDAYQVQIKVGQHAGRGINPHSLLKLLEGLDNLAKQLRVALAQVRAARAAFDAPAEAPLQCPLDSFDPRKDTSAIAALASELDNVEVPILAPEPAARVAGQRLWRSVLEAGRKVKHKATPSAEMQAAVGARLGAAGRSSRSMVLGALDTASRLSEGILSLQEGNQLLRRALGDSPPLQRMRWDEVAGHPSDWINAEEPVWMRRRAEVRLRLHEALPEQRHENPAQSRWERCRTGSERRWSLP